jgi:hypothetical protein
MVLRREQIMTIPKPASVLDQRFKPCGIHRAQPANSNAKLRLPATKRPSGKFKVAAPVE